MSESASRALKWTLIILIAAYAALVCVEVSFAVSGGPRIPAQVHVLIVVGILGTFVAVCITWLDRRMADRYAQAEERAHRRHEILCSDLASYMSRFAARIATLEDFRGEVGSHLMRASGRTTDLENRVTSMERRLVATLDADHDDDQDTTQAIPACAPTTGKSPTVQVSLHPDGTARQPRRQRRRNRKQGRKLTPGTPNTAPLMDTYLMETAQAVELGRELERERLRREEQGTEDQTPP